MTFTIHPLQRAIFLALGISPVTSVAIAATAQPTAGLSHAYDIGVYTGSALLVNNLTTPFKAFTDYAAQNQGWTHTAQFLTLTVGSEADIASGKTYDVQLTMTGRGSLGNTGTSAIDNPAFALWTGGKGALSPAQAYGQHGWNPTRGPNEEAINVAGEADKLFSNDNFHRVGVLNGHVGWIGYVNAGPTYTLENFKDPGVFDPQTASGKVVLDAVSHGALNSSSKLWLTQPEKSSTAYSNNAFLQGNSMVGTQADFASMTLYGLKAGHYLIGTGGSCPTNPAPKTVCGVGQQYTFSVQPLLTLGAKFDTESAISDNLELTAALTTLHDPNDKTQGFALDLQQEVLKNPVKNLLQHIQALPLFAGTGVTLTQKSTGTLEVALGNNVYALAPVKVFKTASEPAGVSFTPDGQLKIVTAAQRRILLNPSVQDTPALTQALLSSGLFISAVNAGNGDLSVLPVASQLIDLPGNIAPPAIPSLVARPAIQSEPATLGKTPGLYMAPYLPQSVANVTVGYLLFKDSKGQLRQQALLPVPADWESLRQALEALHFTDVTLQTDGVIKVVDSKGNDQQALMAYQVVPGTLNTTSATFTAIADVNNDGQGDVQVNYPNGAKQTLILFH
jgi:hypothetical protein